MGGVVKAVGKVASSAVKSVGSVASGIVNGVGKVAQGKVGEGLGDIGQTAARMGLDIVTVGNKSTVDKLTGGIMTTAEEAARGNSKDIVRLGATATAAVYGGPTAAMAANSVFAGGGNILQAGLAGVTNSQGGEMGWLDDIGGFLNNNPGLSQLANNAISGLIPKSAPKVQTVAPAVQTIEIPGSRQGMSTGMIVGIAGGALGLVLVLVLVLKRK